MRVVVVGAGIVGVTSAYELAAQGHEVTVLERRAGVAAEASFANAGVIAPGYVTPWAAPGMPWKVLRQLLGRHAAVRFDGLGPLTHLPWLVRWWLACRPRVYAGNRAAMIRLAQFSRDRLLELTRQLGLDYEQQPGYLVLLRGARELSAAQRTLKLLGELGVVHELVDAERCRRIEPGLHADAPLAGGIHLAQDGVGNCRQFAQLIKAEAQRLGARFRFDTDVTSVQPGKPAVVQTAAGARLEADAVVVCAGVHANRLLAPHGLKLPLAPVYGYSITAPLAQRDDPLPVGPRAALMDERFKVAISRLGQRVRVAGSAELGGTVEKLDPRALETLYKVLDDWFPGAGRMSQVQRWKGARPMLPDGPPVIGASGAEGVWLNLGHGSSGWALACGSAFALAQVMEGREAPIPLEGLGVERLR